MTYARKKMTVMHKIGLASGADSMGHGGHVPPLLQMAVIGGGAPSGVEQQTRN